jgi:hypothetical protein
VSVEVLMNTVRINTMLSALLCATAMFLPACSSDGAEGEGEVDGGEGEGSSAEGEGEPTGEGEGEPNEGEGEPNEGEGEPGEGEGEVLVPGGNERNNPIDASLPFSETIGIPTTEVCYRVTIADDGFIRAGASTDNCAARDFEEDVRLVLLINNVVVADDDDGGIGYCTYTDLAVTAGDEVVVCFNEGGGGGSGNAIAAADVFIEETTGPLPLDALCRNDGGFGSEPPFLPCEDGRGCFDDTETGATTCLVAVIIGVGQPCDPDATNELCDAPAEDDVQCRFDGEASICSDVTQLAGGDSCVAGSETAICPAGLLCTDSVCVNPLLDRCLAAVAVEGTDDDGDGVYTSESTVTAVAGPLLTCGFSSNNQALRYTASVDGLLRIERSGFESMAIFAEDCNEQLLCTFNESETIEVTAGQTIVIFVDRGSPGTIDVSIANAAAVELGEGEPCPSTFNETCGPELFCTTLTCELPEPLDVPGSIEFSLAAGEQMCVVVSLDGPTTIETTGACVEDGDSRFFVLQDGVEVARDDDSGDGSCSLLTQTFEAGEYVVCVEEYLRDDALTGTLTIE